MFLCGGLQANACSMQPLQYMCVCVHVSVVCVGFVYACGSVVNGTRKRLCFIQTLHQLGICTIYNVGVDQ